MDFDDNEYQGQNLQLAGEGCSKVSSVLHPYPIPKFDFDDSLHVHLRFDSAIDKESFLGITSQEDNQWIEEYSRESSGIQLNSSAVESRRNNVWSEATSSESVEMLLRSVGQEEKIVEETVIQHLDLCNAPGSLTEVMDPNLNQESQKAQISSGELESVVENDKLYVVEAKVDNTFDATQMNAKNVENESMDKELLEEPSVTAVVNPGSSENVGASIVELRGLENMQQVAANASGLSEDFSSGAAEHNIQSKQISIDVPDVKAFQKPSSETSNPFGENPSQMMKSEDPDSQKSNVGLMSKLSPIKNYSVDENETTIGKASQQVTSDPSLLSADNMYEMAGERSIEKDAHAGDSEPGAIHVYQGDSFNKKEGASLPVESSERDVEVVRALDSQTNVEPSLSVEGSKENTAIGHTFASDASVQVEQVAAMESDNKETDDQPKSPIFGVSLVHQENKEITENDGILQVETAVASGLRNPSSIVRNEESTDLVEKVVLGIDGHCVKLIESRNTSQSEQEPESNSGGQECIKRLESLCELSEKNGNTSQARGLHDPKESMVEVNKTIEHQTSADVVRPSDFKLKGKQAVTKDVRHGIASQEGKNFSFEVDGSAGLAQDGKGFQSYPTFQVSNLPKILDSSSSHLDATKLHEVPHSPQNTSGLTAQTGVKGKAERKPRRKSVPKENARKSLSLISPATVGFISTAKLPDSNNSTSIFQQPFTDSQQVQLRAQILVYGSVISGSPPEEPHMLAAFGQSDGGRIWEGVWHAYLERLHVQKAQAKSNIPLQTRSDLRDAGNKADQGAKHASVQTKIPSSSIGVIGNKATPPKFSSMIPDSSSLWNISTPSEYRHPYQTPPVQQSFSAHNNPSWLSQGPFAGQWLPPYNTTTFPAFPVSEAVKLTPVKELAGSGIKPTSTPTVLNSASTIFPEASSGDLKSRKRKKSSPVVSNPFSTSDAVSVPALIISKNIPAKFLSAVSPIHDPNKVKVAISEETLIKVEESKLQSEDATKHAAVAVNHCHSVWSQLETQNNSALSSDKEAKLVSSAVSIAAAASVAKVAAAAAKIASDFAEHARSMVNGASLSSSKHAENLNAVVKAAELAAEAVSQAGKIVATSEPMSLLDLVKAGSEGYWKTPRLASKQQPNLNGNDKRIVESAPEVSEKEILNTKSGISRNENIEYVSVEGTSLPFTTHEKSKRKPRVRKGSHLAKTTGVVPELEIGSINTSVGQAHPKASTGLKENIIEEGCLVEVRKDGDTYDGAWFGANVLSVKDGKALVCYTDIKSDEGQLKEWVPLEVGAAEVPKIRSPHPVTTRRLEGTRKRSRTTSTDYVWSSGDLVDVWMQDRWCEGVIMEINKMDVTSLTVNFPAQGVTSLVRSWFVRPTLLWKDGKWVESHTSEKHKLSGILTPSSPTKPLKMTSIAKPIISSLSIPPPPPQSNLTKTHKPHSLHYLPNTRHASILRASYEVGGGYTQQELEERYKTTTKTKQQEDEDSWSHEKYEALLKGGEQVTSVLQEMINLLEDDQMDEESEELAVLLAAQGVIGKRVDQMEAGFMMALDYMIELAEKDDDDKRKSLLEVIKETVLLHLTKKCPPHVQVVGLLCRTPQKESRQELLRRVAAGGGAFDSGNGAKVHLPGANLNDIANQADDLLETMESRPVVPDRKLLARLVLIREEARCMMGGGLLDERNSRGLNTLPRSEVNFLTKLIAQKPGKPVRDMIKNVMLGRDEGADKVEDEESKRGGRISGGIAGNGSVSGSKPNPVRPGMFLETVSKVLGGVYDGNISGITAQHLEWVHQNTLQVLQEIAF